MYELDLDARASASQLARKLKRSKETVAFRINRLIDAGYINYFYTVCNTSKLGYTYYKVYVKFKNITPEKEGELIDYVRNQDHLAFLGSVEGLYDLIFLIMVKTPNDMGKVMDVFMQKYGAFVQAKDICAFLETHRLNNRFLYAGEKREDTFHSGVIGSYVLDSVDQKILDVLSSHARMPITEIAKKVGIDHKAVAYRMRKLEKENIILRYVSSPNFDKLGLQFYQINISLKDPSVKQALISYFDATHACLFAIEMLGKYDILFEVHVENTEKLKLIIDGFRKQFTQKYNDYDILTVNKEYLMVWNPFAEDN